MDYTLKICGEAGQGIQTIGETLSKVFSRSGFHIYSYQDYESRVRGGHNFFAVRFADRPVFSPRAAIDILLALDREGVPRHLDELTEQGFAVYDSTAVDATYEGARFIDVPFERLAVESGGKPIMANTVASGAVLGMLGLDAVLLEGVIEETLAKTGPDAVDANMLAGRAGHDYAERNCPRCSFEVSSAAGAKPMMLVEGNQAVGLGALASGCAFYAAYPMTPSTGILNYLASKAGEYGIVVEQAEDEIAAINMALGASFAGVRAMTGTSGGGFALMVEGLSLSGMTETPVVIVLGQRPGPATGLPTRTEQAELHFALRAAHGEFPRVLLAPGSPQQAFYLVSKAFDLAEKFQVPAIVLTDQLFADSRWTVDMFDLNSVPFKDYRLRGEPLPRITEYRRHMLTNTGVSPMAVPGESRHVVCTDSDEHDEDGHITEDAATRVAMVDKRWKKKLPLIRQEMEAPLQYGSREPEVVLVGWGSTYGVIREAVDELSGSVEAAMLHFSQIYPFPGDMGLVFRDVLNEAKTTLCVENNATGAFARYLSSEIGHEFDAQINRYDGRPFTLEGLLEEIHGHVG